MLSILTGPVEQLPVFQAGCSRFTPFPGELCAFAYCSWALISVSRRDLPQAIQLLELVVNTAEDMLCRATPLSRTHFTRALMCAESTAFVCQWWLGGAPVWSCPPGAPALGFPRRYRPRLAAVFTLCRATQYLLQNNLQMATTWRGWSVNQNWL